MNINIPLLLKRFCKPALLMFIVIIPSGCASVVIGAGATLGTAAMEERSLKTITADTALATKIRFAIVEKDNQLAVQVGVEVFENQALLTGIVPDEKARARAIKLAWSAGTPKAIFNEIQIGDSSVVNFSKDSWATASLTSKLTFDEDVLSINYSIETVNGTVYLMGVAQNQQELDRVIAHARTISYVQNIITHVRIKPPGSAPPKPPASMPPKTKAS